MKSTFFWSAVGLTTASVTYVLFGPTPSKNKRKEEISGLINNGTHCFVNAILQCLAGCNYFTRWLQNSFQNFQKLENYFTFTITGEQRISNGANKLTIALLDTIQSLNSPDFSLKQASPLRVLEALSPRSKFETGEQDAHELFNTLASTLESELYSYPKYSLKDALLIEDKNDQNNLFFPKIQTKGFLNSSGLNDLIPKSLPTKGIFASQLQCTKCTFKYPIRLDMFYSISLAMPINNLGSPILLKDCLDKFVSNEIVHGVNCESCSKSGEKASFVKNLTFAKLPHVLCIHLQRLVWFSNGLPFKRTEHVIAPEFLDMDEYVYFKRRLKGPLIEHFSEVGLLGGSVTLRKNLNSKIKLEHNVPQSRNSKQTGSFRYRLSSVIFHYGDSLSGHFTACRRGTGENSDTWFYTSDTLVKHISLEEVLSMPAYMLFYEKLVK